MFFLWAASNRFASTELVDGDSEREKDVGARIVPSDIQIYCDCMAQIRDRINVVQTIMSSVIHIGLPGKPHLQDQTTELIFVQLRKVLEGIAFATLSANKEKYSEVHANFSKHWRAKDMLKVLGAVNPNFFPVPRGAPITVSPGNHHFGEPLAPKLYKCSSEALHTHNPYREGDQTIYTKYTVPQWVDRVQKLLSWHDTELLNGDRWVVNIPRDGPVQAWAAIQTT